MPFLWPVDEISSVAGRGCRDDGLTRRSARGVAVRCEVSGSLRLAGESVSTPTWKAQKQIALLLGSSHNSSLRWQQDGGEQQTRGVARRPGDERANAPRATNPQGTRREATQTPAAQKSNNGNGNNQETGQRQRDLGGGTERERAKSRTRRAILNRNSPDEVRETGD